MIATQTSTTGPSQAQAGAERPHPSRSGRASHTTIVSQDESTGIQFPPGFPPGQQQGFPAAAQPNAGQMGMPTRQQSRSTRRCTDAERCQRLSGESYDLPPFPPSQPAQNEAPVQLARKAKTWRRIGPIQLDLPLVLVQSRWARNRPIFRAANRPLRICTTAKERESWIGVAVARLVGSSPRWPSCSCTPSSRTSPRCSSRPGLSTILASVSSCPPLFFPPSLPSPAPLFLRASARVTSIGKACSPSRLYAPALAKSCRVHGHDSSSSRDDIFVVASHRPSDA
ncbi:hypothetical protein L1887_48323 [Cichorium endivia]|nr:hypothetical protein L1887_48323 [Cichorium endivia]